MSSSVSPSLHLCERSVPPWACLSLVGELDLLGAPPVSERIRAHVDDGVLDVCVDLSGIAFMDSAGVALLLGAQRLLQREGGRLVVLAPPGQARDLLTMTGTDALLDLERDFGALRL